MREIKFRAWSDKDNKMTHFNLHSLTGIYNDIWEYINEEKIMQFTGVKDSTGKEIYEGDVIQFTTYELLIKGIVGFDNGCFIVREIGYDYEYFNEVPESLLLWINERDCKIIGNIHENNELITTEI